VLNQGETWVNLAIQEAWDDAQRLLRDKTHSQSLADYQKDPVGFGQDVLHETYISEVAHVMESVRDNPVTIARSGNAIGKSHGAARIAVWFYRVFDDAQVYLTAAPPFDNLRRILWGEVMSVVRKNSPLFKNDEMRALSIIRHSQSFIRCVAIPTSGTSEERQAKFSGKHAPHLLFIVDEGDAVPEEVYQGIESCMSGGMARMLIMFNPRAQAGHIYDMEANSRANVVHLSAFKHPNVVTGKDVIPGAVSRAITVRRINEWTRPLSQEEQETEANLKIPDFLVGSVAVGQDGKEYPPLAPEPRVITEPAFYYMVLGDYPAQGPQQLISEEWISAARSRHDLYVARYGDQIQKDAKPVLGLDVAEYGTDANVACIRSGGFFKFYMWSGVDPDDSARRTLDLYVQNNCRIAFIDGTGIGSGIAPSMARRGRENDVRAVSVKVASSPSGAFKIEDGEFYRLRDQLWWMLREWLNKDQSAMLPNDPMLLDELRFPRYKKVNGKIRVSDKDQFRASLKRSPDCADALMMTFTPIERAKVLSLM
jgi:hypothetical protein